MIYILIIIAIVIAETKIKSHMEKNMKVGERKEILNGKIVLRKHYNTGLILNYFENKKEMVKTVSSVFLGFLLLLFAFLLPKKGNRLFKLGLALVLGGAISNVSDRINKGHVVDYFSFNFKQFPKLKKIIFNLSDIFIFIGSSFIALAGFISDISHIRETLE
ncbi:MAG: signal peptidase II [Bacteroidales bacterium]|nr:signal peptidase II [Bacteroidales bacterium]